MNETIRKICTDYITNRDVLKKTFQLESGYMFPAAACTLTAAGVTADPDRLKELKKMLKKSVDSLSYLRGTLDMSIITKMYISDDPQAFIDRTKACYDVIKKQLGRSAYTALLSLAAAETTDEAGAAKIAADGKVIFDMMKKEHPILTGSEDSVMAGFMAMTCKDAAELCDGAEQCFTLLKKHFSDKQAVQNCSHILAMADGTAEDKTARLVSLFELLGEAGKKYGKSHELAALAAISLFDEDKKVLADTICEIDAFLETQKGYGALGFGKKERLMHAAMLTAVVFKPENDITGVAATVSTIAMLAAQEAALCAIIACSAATSAAAAAN